MHPFPQIKYNYDLNKTNVLGVEDRRISTNLEHTIFLLVPPRGCQYNCDFCSPRHIANPDIPLTIEFADKVANEIGEILSTHPMINTVVLFNAGNILYGTESGQKAGAIHEHFWNVLPSFLEKHPNVKTLEFEVRLDNLKDPALSKRIDEISSSLKKIGDQLRIRIALNDLQKRSRANMLELVKSNDTPWIAYAMLGGKLKRRSLSPNEAVFSAAATSIAALNNGALEVIINCQYLDPINQLEEKRSGVNYYIPSREDVIATILLLAPHLGRNKRIRLCLDKENVIVDTKGPADYDPAIDGSFRSLINGFNNAEDQKVFFEEYLIMGG